MKVHVAIVSEQVLANLIPALMERPEVVVLVASDEMVRRKLAGRLERLLEKAGMDVVVKPGVPEVGLAAIHEFALELLGELGQRWPGAEVVLNATGGTKLMSLGFVEFFRGAARIIYTDTRHRCIEVLPDGREGRAEPVPMGNVLDVPRYLEAQGLRYVTALSDNVDGLARVQTRKPVAKHLAHHAPQLESFFRAMNKLADEALGRGETLVAPHQALHYAPDARSPWAAALRKLSEAKVLSWQEGGADIGFFDAAGAAFLRGGWLEEYAFHVIRDAQVQDTRLGVEVRPFDIRQENADKVRNEFDVLACHGNQLLFVECKTVRFHEGENDNTVSYKLKSLGETARGLFGESWLLSAQAPTEILVERCRQARIRLLGPADLPKLREQVLAWMEGR